MHAHTRMYIYTDTNSKQWDQKITKYYRIKASFGFYLVPFPDNI